MRVYVIDGEGKARLAESLEGVTLSGSRLVWADATDPSPEERELLRDFFALHPLAAEAPLERETAPRVAEFDDHILMVWSLLRDAREPQTPEMISLYMILGNNYLISAHAEDIREIDAAFKRLRGESAPRHDHPVFLLYGILNASVEGWFPVVEAIKDDIDDYMDDMLSDTGGDEVNTVMALKHKNMEVRRTLSALRDVVMRLARRDLTALPDGLNAYLMDIYDRLTRAYLEVDNNSDLISSSLDIHLSVVSNRLNVTMKRLTAVTTIFLPATFLAGVYGTNFIHMPEYAWYFGYLYFWLAVIAITLAMFLVARRQNWF